METRELRIGLRVKLNEKGRTVFKRTVSPTGTVVSLPKPWLGGANVGVLLDGNKQLTRIHRSCLDPETSASDRSN
jgi:hypothetical protein